MIGRFWFYRRRRALPFLAVYCLVFINGATLVPLAYPAPHADAAAAEDGDAGSCDRTDSWHHASYERAYEGLEQESVVAGCVPPIVKNLRRPSPGRNVQIITWRGGVCAAEASCPIAGSMQRVLAWNAADLTRLCRRLL